MVVPSDEVLVVSTIWRGKPISKKNCHVIRWVGKKHSIGPNSDYMAYEKAAAEEAGRTYRQSVDHLPPLGTKKLPVHVIAQIYQGGGVVRPRDGREPYRVPSRCDLDGLMASVADVLQRSGLLANDYWIVSWDGTRRHVDMDDPRVEAHILVKKKDLEKYQAKRRV